MFKAALHPPREAKKLERAPRSRRASLDEKQIQRALRESAAGRKIAVKGPTRKKNSRLFERRRSRDDFELGRRSPPPKSQPLPGIRNSLLESRNEASAMRAPKATSFRVGSRLLAQGAKNPQPKSSSLKFFPAGHGGPPSLLAKLRVLDAEQASKRNAK